MALTLTLNQSRLIKSISQSPTLNRLKPGDLASIGRSADTDKNPNVTYNFWNEAMSRITCELTTRDFGLVIYHDSKRRSYLMLINGMIGYVNENYIFKIE